MLVYIKFRKAGNPSNNLFHVRMEQVWPVLVNQHALVCYVIVSISANPRSPIHHHDGIARLSQFTSMNGPSKTRAHNQDGLHDITLCGKGLRGDAAVLCRGSQGLHNDAGFLTFSGAIRQSLTNARTKSRKTSGDTE